jgi:hypothetical protein
MVIKKRNLSSLLGLCSCLLWCGALYPVWAPPQTQDLKGEVLDDKNQLIVEASCTLTGQMLPQQGIAVTTGEKGEFRFSGLLAGTYDLKCAALGCEPVAQCNLEVTETGAPFVQVVLRKEIIVRGHVVVRGTASTISADTTAPPTTLSSAQLTTLPLAEQKFKAALFLVPGVVRMPDGEINIKGSVETQGLLLVDSADAVEPVSGSFSIEEPIDPIESVEVHKNAEIRS